MEITLTIGNYRCFGREEPARLVLRPGFAAVVGANNAGKSATLRFLWEFRELFHRLSVQSGNLFQAIGGVPQAFHLPVADAAELFADTNDDDLTFVVEIRPASGGSPPLIDQIVVTVPRNSNTFTLSLWVGGQRLGPVSQWRDGIPEDGDGRAMGDLQAIYEACAALANCYYIGPLRTTQGNAGGTDFDSEVGGTLITRWRQLKLGGSKTNRQRAAVVTERIRALFDLDQFDIDVGEDNNRLIATVDGQTYGYNELGSGLGHFSVALVNLAARDSVPSWILVDEPENGLHPTLQLAFLTILASLASEGLVFATHSYGLARRLADRIYVVRRDRSTRTSTLDRHEAVKSLAEFLGELGFSGYRDLGFDRILLVEGPTDVPAIGEFLRLLGRRENLVLLPLGGSDVINAKAEPYLLEVKRLSDKVYAVIDSERTSEATAISKSRLGFRNACKKAAIPCHILERRSIENYLSDAAVKGTLGTSYRALSPYESLKHRKLSWPKEMNWRIASRMKTIDIESTDLGAFLRAATEPTAAEPPR